MSNHLAIATVTAVLQRTLQASVQRHVESVRISTIAPHRIGQGTPETGINLFLYHVSRNNALKNPDALTQRARNKRTPWRQAALELHYMLSFYGNEAELEPQRLMGSVVRTFNDRTTLSTQLIQDTLSDSTFSYLDQSDLSQQVQELQITPEDLSLDDLSKVWSVFFQTPYALSMAYKVMAVVIDGEDPADRALQVRERPIQGITPFPSRPQVDRILAQEGPYHPILPTTCLYIQGTHLKGPQTRIRLGHPDLAPQDLVPQDLTDDRLSLPLAAVPTLRAGIQSLQVIHHREAIRNPTDPSPPSLGLSSSPVPFSLCPLVQSVRVDAITDHDGDTCVARLALTVSPPVGARQGVLISLYEWSTQQPASYLVEVPSRDQDSDQLFITVRGIQPGTYLVRLIIDGAESPLDIDSDPNSPTYQWYAQPRIAIA
ncbi:MAG: DUF4255 domain-containing protein [Leptolyngbya sp.]|nr:DUF4255 domain-containing protein [Leptolyngbya sp.]